MVVRRLSLRNLTRMEDGVFMNVVTIIGRVTKELEISYTRKGTPNCTFTIAIRRDYKNSNGNYDADFIRIAAWREVAQLLVTHVKKGEQIGVNGQLRSRTYVDKNGIKKYITEVRAQHIKFLDYKRRDDDDFTEQIDGISEFSNVSDEYNEEFE